MLIQAKFLFLVFIFSTSPIFVSQAVSKTAGYTEISAPEARMLQEKHWNVSIINVLSKLEFELQRIPGSINIPINKFSSTTLLPKDKTTPLILYCMEVR